VKYLINRRFLSVTIFAPNAPGDSNRRNPFARETCWLACCHSSQPSAVGAPERKQASQRVSSAKGFFLFESPGAFGAKIVTDKIVD
jgi:hypothetical protein